MNETQIKQVQAMYAAGVPAEAIARALNLHVEAVLEAVGEQPPPPPQPPAAAPVTAPAVDTRTKIPAHLIDAHAPGPSREHILRHHVPDGPLQKPAARLDGPYYEIRGRDNDMGYNGNVSILIFPQRKVGVDGGGRGGGKVGL
jgi:hypothetical protein